jgi:transcriptional regulator with XRE-family HTH domain
VGESSGDSGGIRVSCAPSLQEIERHISQRIRQRRVVLCLTQDQLGERIGIRAQFIHKYETGAVRVHAGMLREVAEALEVKVAYFYEGLTESEGRAADELAIEPSERLLMDLLRSFTKIRSAKARETLLQVACNLADTEGDDEDDEGQETG